VARVGERKGTLLPLSSEASRYKDDHSPFAQLQYEKKPEENDAFEFNEKPSRFYYDVEAVGQLKPEEIILKVRALSPTLSLSLSFRVIPQASDLSFRCASTRVSTP
jgi:hypothetical protein